MKLRNKKTGEIDDYIFEVITDRIDLYRRVGHSDTKNIWHYNSLAELAEEWEDMPEEPKEFWFVDAGGEVEEATYLTENDKANLANFGNYFETEEEAEKAVEKLKAWERLKDKGYYFKGWHLDKLHFEIELRVKEYDFVTDELKQDLDLLFGNKEKDQ